MNFKKISVFIFSILLFFLTSFSDCLAYNNEILNKMKDIPKSSYYKNEIITFPYFFVVNDWVFVGIVVVF